MIIPIVSACSVFGVRDGYEQSDYQVVESLGEIEIRRYPSQLAVEIQNAPDRNTAFYALFDYISGKNGGAKKVAMTAPVEVDTSSGSKIAMTSPVEVQEGESVSMRFFLPKEYTIETAPVPEDPRVALVTTAEEIVAVLRYSGSQSDDKFEGKKQDLLDYLEKSDWDVVGEPRFLGYDPPFTLPFLRRNEVVVTVANEVD